MKAPTVQHDVQLVSSPQQKDQHCVSAGSRWKQAIWMLAGCCGAIECVILLLENIFKSRSHQRFALIHRLNM